MWQIVDPNITHIHFQFILGVQIEFFFWDWDGGICTTVDVVTSLGIIVLAFELLDSLGPT